MPIKHSWSLLRAVAVFASVGVNVAHAAPLMIVGNDEKLLWDDNSKPIISPAGKDSVLIVDLAEPENPKIVANLPLKNSVVGPPVNVAIDPMNSVALVADSIDVIRDGDALKMGPDNKVYVIDLKANLVDSRCAVRAELPHLRVDARPELMSADERSAAAAATSSSVSSTARPRAAAGPACTLSTPASASPASSGSAA